MNPYLLLLLSLLVDGLGLVLMAYAVMFRPTLSYPVLLFVAGFALVVVAMLALLHALHLLSDQRRTRNILTDRRTHNKVF